jgi:hypothetical protein
MTVWTSFNIGAGGATELSVCDYSAEPEMRCAEGEGVKNGFVEIPAQTVARPLREYELGVALSLVFQFPDSAEGGILLWGRSKRASAMTHKAITLQFVVPAVLAVIALGISIGAVYLTVKYLVLIDRSEARHSAAGGLGIAELPNPTGGFRAFTCCFPV